MHVNVAKCVAVRIAVTILYIPSTCVIEQNYPQNIGMKLQAVFIRLYWAFSVAKLNHMKKSGIKVFMRKT